MIFSVYDFKNLYAVFLENELVFGFDRAVLSIKLDCRDFEYKENGIVLYGSEPNGLLRSNNTLTLSDKSRLIAMHDGSAEIRALNGSRITFKENGTSYEFTCSDGVKSLLITLKGSCRCEDNMIFFRRGETIITLSEPTAAIVTPKRRGFEYEAERCLSLITDLNADSELLPMLLLVNGLKNAVYDKARAENIRSIIPTMSEQNKKTAEAVTARYYRAFGYDENNIEKGRYR